MNHPTSPGSRAPDLVLGLIGLFGLIGLILGLAASATASSIVSPPRALEVRSVNGRFQVLVSPGGKDVARATWLDEQTAQKRVFPLINVRAPSAAAVTNDGVVLTFGDYSAQDNADGVVCYGADGSVRWARSAKDVPLPFEMGSRGQAVWLRTPVSLEVVAPSAVRVALWGGARLRIDVNTGAMVLEPFEAATADRGTWRMRASQLLTWRRQNNDAFGEVEDAYLHALELNLDDEETQFDLGSLYQDHNRRVPLTPNREWRRALLERIVARVPLGSPPTRPLTFDSQSEWLRFTDRPAFGLRVGLARAQQNTCRTPEAVRTLQALLKVVPASEEVLVELVTLEHLAGQHEEAARTMAQHLGALLGEAGALPLSVLGISAVLDDFSPALPAYAAEIKKDPGNIHLAQFVATAEARAGHLDRAAEVVARFKRHAAPADARSLDWLKGEIACKRVELHGAHPAGAHHCTSPDPR